MRPEPRIRVSALLRWHGAILLIRHEKRGREHWLLPGGGVRSGETLVEALQPERSLGHSPLYQALFALQNIGVGRLELPGLQVSGMGLGTTSSNLKEQASVADRTTRHRVDVAGLRPATTYHYRVVSVRPDGTRRTWPATGQPAATFRTPGADNQRPVVSGVTAFALPDGTAQVSWATNEPATSRVDFGRSATELTSSRADDTATREHTVVLTGLP